MLKEIVITHHTGPVFQCVSTFYGSTNFMIMVTVTAVTM